MARTPAPGVSAMVPMIHVTDHLGSVRAVVDGVSGEVVETNDYYPFGSRWDVDTSLKDDTNRFRYNSKEEQSPLYPASFRDAVSYIDYGARQYDPVLGRWFAQDPLAEKYYGISPYAFCAGNPVKYIDSDGRYFDDDNEKKVQRDERKLERRSLKLSKKAERLDKQGKDSRNVKERSKELKKSAQDIRDMRNDADTEYRFIKSTTPKIRALEETNNNGNEVIVISYINFETRLHESRHGGQHAREEIDVVNFNGYGVMDEVDAYRAQYSWSGVYNYLYDDLSSEAILRRVNAGLNPLIGTISNIDNITPAFINRLIEDNNYLYPPLGIKLDYWNSH